MLKITREQRLSVEPNEPRVTDMRCRCFIVPPHLLRGIADSSHNPEHVRKAAQNSLLVHDRVTTSRRDPMAALGSSEGRPRQQSSPFVPEGVLARLSVSRAVDEATRNQAKRDLNHLQGLMSKSQEVEPVAKEVEDVEKRPPSKDQPHRSFYDAKESSDEDALPGELIRAEGEAKVNDKDVNFAFDNVGTVLDFYKEHFKWNSIDNKNSDIVSSVHFGHGYENAYWDSNKRQMVFGDGDFLHNFTSCIDVIGHELTHAITEHTSPLQYMDQSGALNEHVSGVFGIMVKQKLEDEKASEADWLIGEGCLLPNVKGLALRSMKRPGTAYDDARLGKDPQISNMMQYEKMYEDNRGVHINSGIPNKAFYLAAVAFGGYSWEKAGQIWWKALRSGHVPPRCTFQQFSDVTIDCAREEFGEAAARKVRKAWSDVGVARKADKTKPCNPL